DSRRPRAPPALDHLLRDQQPVLGHEHVDAAAERDRRIDTRPLGAQQARHAPALEEALHHVRLGRRRRRVAGAPVHQYPSLALIGILRSRSSVSFARVYQYPSLTLISILRSRSCTPSLPKELPGDHQALDLRRALV